MDRSRTFSTDLCSHGAPGDLDFRDEFMPAWVVLDENAREVRLHFILVTCGRCDYQLVDTFLVGLATWERYEIDQARL